MSDETFLRGEIEEFQRNLQRVQLGQEDHFLALAGVSRETRIRSLQDDLQVLHEELATAVARHPVEAACPF